MDIKPLKPTLREKKRYVAVGIKATAAKEAVLNDLETAFQRYLGDYGIAASGVKVIPETWDSNGVIVRCSANHVAHVKAALTMVQSIGGHEALVYTKGVSGLLTRAKASLGG